MPVKRGDLVLLDYAIYVIEDGEKKLYDTTVEDRARSEGIYDENRNYGPVPVIAGAGQLIDAVEEAVIGMEEGEEKEIEAPPEKAYGLRDERLVFKIPVKRLAAQGIRPRLGMELEVNGRRGRIVKLTERFAYVDTNHPLAGKRLHIWIRVAKILESPEDKIKYLTVRVFRLPPEHIHVEKIGEKEYKLRLPPDVLMVRDLEAVMTTLLRYIYQYTDARRVVIEIPAEFRREEAPEKAEEPGGAGKSDEKVEEEASQ